MRDDFCAFILSYKRADRVKTYDALRRSGYTGKIYIVVGDDDPTIDEYRRRYGDQVLVFPKEEMAQRYDQGDNFYGRQSVVYARNACWELAKKVGAQYFIELDDDYGDFLYRLAGKRAGEIFSQYHGWIIKSIDRVFDAMVRYLDDTNSATIAMSQGGDHIAGKENGDIKITRKAMNSFVCNVDRPFYFLGRINEDTTAYVTLGNRGYLFWTHWPLQLNQTQTQQNLGGLTETYLDLGTYVKSFYSVMYAPSCVTVEQSKSMRRMHHKIAWDNAVPKIIHERHRHAS